MMQRLGCEPCEGPLEHTLCTPKYKDERSSKPYTLVVEGLGYVPEGCVRVFLEWLWDGGWLAVSGGWVYSPVDVSSY